MDCLGKRTCSQNTPMFDSNQEMACRPFWKIINKKNLFQWWKERGSKLIIAENEVNKNIQNPD